MTIAIGVLCEAGAVLVTDSMVTEVLPTGKALGHLADPEWKLRRAPGVAYVHAGHGIAPPSLPEAADWTEQARNLLAYFGQAHPALNWAGRLRNSDGTAASAEVLADAQTWTHELVVAPMPQPQQGPRLGLLTLRPDRSDRWLSEPGIVVAGSPRLWAEEEKVEYMPVPADLPTAARLAVSLAASFIRHHYRGRTFEEILDAGMVPVVAYPLHVLAIDGHGVHYQEVRAES